MRIIWHPDVHRLYGEQLSFIFIKPRQHGKQDQADIVRVISALQIKGYHYYDVFGAVDIIIRLWARQEKRDALLASLSELPNVVVRTVFTSAETPRYLWWQGYQIELSRSVIQKHRRQDLEKAQLPDGETDARELQADGLLVFKDSPPDFESRIKFFVYIGIHSAPSKEAVVRKLQEALASSPEIEETSIYTAPGTNYLIKATTIEYASIGRFVLSIADFLSPTECITETHLVAAATRIDSDFIDFKPTNPAIARMCGLWKIREDSLRKMPEDQQRSLAEAYERLEYSPILKIDERELVKNCFEAVIENDPDLLLEKISFLLDFENRLYQFTAKIMADIYGNSWVKTDFQRLKDAAKIPNDFGPAKWTFSDSLSLLGKANGEANNRIQELLGDNDWKNTLSNARDIRNNLAHGKLANPLQDWPELLSSIMKIVPLYYTIRLYLRKPAASD